MDTFIFNPFAGRAIFCIDFLFVQEIKLVKRVLVFVIILFVFLNCESYETKSAAKAAPIIDPLEKLKIVYIFDNARSSINWAYLESADRGIMAKFRSNNKDTTGNIDDKFVLEPNQDFFTEKKINILDRMDFDKWKTSSYRVVTKDYKKIDPFEKQRIMSEDLKTVKARKFYLKESSNFDITKYDLSKESYSFSIPELFDLTIDHVNFPNCDTKDKLEFSVLLPKGKASAFRTLKVKMLLHLEIIKPKVRTETSTVCEKTNQFAKDGCLQWKKKIENVLSYTIGIHQVSFLGYDLAFLLGNSEKFEVYDYQFKKNKPTFSCYENISEYQ